MRGLIPVQTKLGLFCGKIIEAGWLMAAIVTPLFFNWYSNRVFEASKVTLLRSITMVMLAAWLIKMLETGLPGEGSKFYLILLRKPLIVPVLFFAGAYLLSTATSIVPRVSFWGSYHRRQGLSVVLCYIAIFFMLLETLRTRRQLERLIKVILLTSLPISLYGIMQHYKVDPLVWLRGGAYRVESTLGNPILIGAYLIMVVPLTIWQLIRSLSLIRTERKRSGASLVLFGYYFVLLIFQLTCLVFTQSRGPAMGFMAGAFFFSLLLAILRRRKGLALAVLQVSIALFLILAILNLPNSPLKLPKGIPYVGRLARASRDIIRDRGLIWHGAVNMVTIEKTRALVGYGPDSMGLIFYRYMHPDWAASKGYKVTADRCHNDTLDAWVAGGLIGLVAYLVLFGSIFYYGLKELGLVANPRQRTFLVVAWLVGGLLGVLIPWLMEGSLRWAGVGIPAGILLGLVMYLMTTLFGQRPTSDVRCPMSDVLRPTSEVQILLIALFSAIIAHFVEIQFGIAITATRAYFWLYAALLVITSYCWKEEPVPEVAAGVSPPTDRGRRRGRRRRGRRQGVGRPKPWTLNSEFLAHALLVGLILATTSFDLVSHRFDLETNGPVIFGLLFVVWLLGAVSISDLRFSVSDFWTYILGSLFCFLPFIAAHAAIVLPGTGVERVIVVYYAYAFSVILAVAATLMLGLKPDLPLRRFSAWWLYPVIAIGTLLLIFNANLKGAQADIYFKFGLSSEERKEMDKAIAIYRHAINLAPRWDQYYSSLGWAYGLKAIAASDAGQRIALLKESLRTLRHAQQMNPFDPDIATRLGHLHWNWGRLTPEPGQRAEKLERALAHYQQAVRLSPLNHGHLLKGNIVRTYLYLGETYATLGKLSQAVEAYRRASEMAPDNYKAHKGLALVYMQLGHLDKALNEAKIARDLAPEEKRAELDDLIVQLGDQKR